MNQPCTNSVLVVGAGIGGLTAALSLHATGVAATVIESARDIRPLGVGINLLPHGVRELTELGLGADLAAIAIATAENVYLDAAGRRFWAEPRGQALGYLWPQYSVHRGQLQMLLLTAARERLGPDAIRIGTRLDDFDQTPTQVRARVTNRVSGATEEIEADVLIGADGLHSTVLARLHHRAPPLHWSGVQMWRGLTEAERFLTGRSMIIANDSAATRLVAYPVSGPNPETGRALINWVCLVSVAEPGPLPGDAGWNRSGRVQDVLPHYADWNLGCLDVSKLIAESTEILEYPMADRNPLPWWGEGRITLLGDAAHLMYPVGADGASQAIVDARTLAYHLATASDPVTALARYENIRKPATTDTVDANRTMDQAERATARTGHDRSRIYTAITHTYRHATGCDVKALNTRRSLTPA